MRLSNKEVEAINQTFKKIFKEGSIYLFGSRIDDNKKGGDIDLYIVSDNATMEKKIKFLSLLKENIGDQKIDIVISRDKSRTIEQKALKEGVLLNDAKLRVQKYLNECQKHKIRIEKSYKKVKDIFPLSAPRYETLSDEEVEAIDQYLFRFAKLQDSIGNKLFRLIVSEYVDDIEKTTFLDILNKLEKIGILDSVTIWKNMRDIRNSISHQYDDDSKEMAEALNNIFAYKDELLKIFDKISDYYNKG